MTFIQTTKHNSMIFKNYFNHSLANIQNKLIVIVHETYFLQINIYKQIHLHYIKKNNSLA
ncbi:MAG: hypothetical protein AMR96_06405 [Candidatus Adiutrix intracellularis]|nr:MAG: hypothetical protein AMR96_06405 [Candidatus Adiutrix intracellularis]